MKIGILRETDSHNDKRVAIVPVHAKQLINKYKGLEIKVQPSLSRAFTDNEYKELGFEINENLSDCDVLIGIKKVEEYNLIPGKTYFFFAHVAKQQPLNKEYLKLLSRKEISLIDYEYLKDESGKRSAAFGHMAGIIGTYHLLNILKIKTNGIALPELSRAESAIELISQIDFNKNKAYKILITGSGNAARGASDLLNSIGLQEVEPDKYLNKKFNSPVFCRIKTCNIVQQAKKRPFNKNHFYRNPEQYFSILKNYITVTDAYAACHYWENHYPIYLNNECLINNNKLLVAIADISCDINGGVVSTVKESTHENPYYDYNPITGKDEPAFTSKSNITVMSIGNLPSAMPRESSEQFSLQLLRNVMPHLIGISKNEFIENATILDRGKLTPKFSYLYSFLYD